MTVHIYFVVQQSRGAHYQRITMHPEKNQTPEQLAEFDGITRALNPIIQQLVDKFHAQGIAVVTHKLGDLLKLASEIQPFTFQIDRL